LFWREIIINAEYVVRSLAPKVISHVWKIPLDRVKYERVKTKNSLEGNIDLKTKRIRVGGSMKCKVFNVHLSEGYGKNDESALNEFLENIKVSRIFSSVIGGEAPFWSVLIFYEDKTEKVKHTLSAEEITLTPAEEGLYEALRRWRNEQATKDGIAPYMIAHNSWLKQMIKMHVKTKEDLLRIKGFGEKRTEKYGDDILKVIESFLHNKE